MTSTYPEVGRSIKSEGKIIESTEETLKAAIEKFNEKYLRAIGVDIIEPEAVEEEVSGAAEEAAEDSE